MHPHIPPNAPEFTRTLTYHLTRLIPKGSVATYGQIAKLAGTHPRVIGNYMHTNPYEGDVPCHRVVTSTGNIAETFAFGGEDEQQKRLEAEGITFEKGKVPLKKHQWQPTYTFTLYTKLLREYGFPGPWPWYDTDDPHTPDIVAIGCILTQNTNWNNAVYALQNLEKEDIKTIPQLHHLAETNISKLEELIQPARFYRQKAQYLHNLTTFILKQYGSLRNMRSFPTQEIRHALLQKKGIGPETADTIILYAIQKPIFIIDTYTRRFVEIHSLAEPQSYESLQKMFHTEIPCDLEVYQNYHALIVRWAQLHKELIA